MSLLPNKTIRPQYSLIGVGGQIIQLMTGPETVTSLWNKAKGLETINTYEKFVTGLSLLYALNAIEIYDGLLVKNEN